MEGKNTRLFCSSLIWIHPPFLSRVETSTYLLYREWKDKERAKRGIIVVVSVDDMEGKKDPMKTTAKYSGLIHIFFGFPFTSISLIDEFIYNYSQMNVAFAQNCAICHLVFLLSQWQVAA
jgi:hypothetical protein